ncbi:uncharacterized protein LOC120268566 [Dioscorea cayenensis subsp. rotundata]|uniref:Uncharacterized protein LOC120268566 n=1 Tax=Dioscorea cayennensis subsp. rotundata TaxID=55577 RepID=A0AB40BWJ9_DIOCR|nr:uncharacterized protein LOC120268566 [Dioscorea cayenensis subsp. rotundata]
MRASFPFALPTLRSHGYQSKVRVGSRYHEPSVPHIYQEASVVHRFHRMLLSLGKNRVSVQLCFGCFAIDRPSSCSFPVHSLCISDTQGRTRWEGSSPSLCPADHSAGIFYSRLRLTAPRGYSYSYVSLSGSLAPPVVSFFDMLLSSPYSICPFVISALLQVNTSERSEGLHLVTPRSPSERSQ